MGMTGIMSSPGLHSNVGDRKDMIGGLPDSILHYILSLLPSIDAVRTSILAKRWRYLWTYLSVLLFELRPLRYDTLYFPTGIHFPFLKTLNLSRVTFANENSVQQLFSGCPVLQELTLYNCYWVNIKQISIAISTLKMLTIRSDLYCLDYDDFLNCSIKIDAVNLLSLSFTSDPTVQLVLVNPTSSIVDAHIDLQCYYQDDLYVAGCAIEVLSGLNSVKSLRLSIDTLECLSYEKDDLHLLPSFPNLTHLYVLPGYSDFTSEALMDILPKTPKLEVLEFPKGFDEDWTLNSVPCCFKSSLKLFCISNFAGYEAEIQWVKFLLENATVLREIQIFCSGYLSSNSEKLAHIKNQLQPLGLGKCVLKFQYPFPSIEVDGTKQNLSPSTLIYKFLLSSNNAAGT